ncbi:MAG: asparagine synthase-related protein [Promethearchaeia archaeon]
MEVDLKYMTGIFMYKDFNGGNVPESIKSMEKKISHRGKFLKKKIVSPHGYLTVYFNKPQITNQLIEFWDKERDILVKVIIDGQIFNAHSLANLLKKHTLHPNRNIGKLIYEGYNKKGYSIFKKLSGYYSILIVKEEKVIIAKDPIGHNPLYYSNNNGCLIIASELKAFINDENQPRYLQPGVVHIFDGEDSSIKKFHSFEQSLNKCLYERDKLSNIRKSLFNRLERAVQRAINTPGKVGSLLSGGIDSSVICALLTKHLREVNVFTVAAQGSKDLQFAKLFAEEYNDQLNHKFFIMEKEEMIEIIPDVIYHLESFDAALIRSAIPMYYISSKLEGKVDVLLTGEGGDELFGGYHYLKELSEKELQAELKQLLDIEHALGLQRVDRIPYAFGIEARAPWFDLQLSKLAFQIPMGMKLRNQEGKIMEKWIIRHTFKDILPREIAWREKAKFSKGVGSQFMMRDHFDDLISNEEFEREKEIYKNIKVRSKEELYYWRVFREIFNPTREFIKNLPRTENFSL